MSGQIQANERSNVRHKGCTYMQSKKAAGAPSCEICINKHETAKTNREMPSASPRSCKPQELASIPDREPSCTATQLGKQNTFNRRERLAAGDPMLTRQACPATQRRKDLGQMRGRTKGHGRSNAFHKGYTYMQKQKAAELHLAVRSASTSHSHN